MRHTPAPALACSFPTHLIHRYRYTVVLDQLQSTVVLWWYIFKDDGEAIWERACWENDETECVFPRPLKQQTDLTGSLSAGDI